ncbi:hypothetical protein BGZ95_003516 [Linnemannia exigua]|uniref:Uncharacterized protein n=1 Tax=Linnemannia exigua TaxID=604196 RepID=A0AAD4D438_9FUNG|nr:hypothetical protein BGZ95_003516 [Linnemannia exigua]
MPPSALCRSRKLKTPSSPSKSVQIDESKNMVFSYQSGSTISALLPLADGSFPSQDRSEYDQDDDLDDPVHKNDGAFAKNSFDATGSSSMSSPWWAWSSAATSSPNSSQSGSLDNKNKELSGSSPPLSWTPEASGGVGGGSLDSTLRDSGNGSNNNTFMNIASSLDRLWSPPLLRRTISEVSSSSGSGSSRVNRRGSRMSSGVSGGREAGGLPRIPILRRQASMPSLEREMSEENPFMEPPTWSPTPSQSQESGTKSPELTVNNSGSSSPVSQGSTPAAESDSHEVVMTEIEPEPESQVNAFQTPSSSLTPTTTTNTVTTKSSRGVIRRRDTRQLHHPYRRPTPPSTSDASQDASLLALPAQFRRAASFNGTTSTPVAHPVLRREASTTAYMDIL